MTIFRNKLLLKATLASRGAAQQLEGNRFSQWLTQDQESPASSLLPLLWGSTALSALTIVLLVLNLLGVLPQYWILSLLCSVVLFFTTKKTRGDIFDDAYYLRDAFATLGSVFAYLETYRYGEHQQLKKLCEPFFAETASRPSLLLQRIARLASAATLDKNLLLSVLVNAFVPWHVYCSYRLRQYRALVGARLPIWLDTWFELEVLNSLATFAYLNPEYTLPRMMTEEEQRQKSCVLFQGEALGHPLLSDDKKVTNDFMLNTLGEVVIITGSNMSGKSTFLRTLGVNLCLAYAGAPVNARLFETPLFRLFTCIRVSDSVTDGYSYFYAEVRRLRALLGELQQAGFPLFFLIDEIFKGTNNRERLIGSRSYVRALAGRNCVGAISTHDLELVTLADRLPNVKNYHFREDVVNGHMVFDYTLRSGPSPTTNALKIMQMEGLPVDEMNETDEVEKIR